MSKDRRDKTVSQKFAIVVALAVAMCVASAANAALHGLWTFNEGSGTTAYDTSGVGTNGILSGGASYVATPGGYGVELDGVSGMVTIGDPGYPAYNFGGPFTLEVWVLKTAPEGMGEAMVFGKDQYTYGISSYHPNPASDGWYTAYGNGGGNNVGTGTRVTGQWSYLVETYDGNAIQLWWNGIDQGTKVVGTIPISGNPLIIGGVGSFSAYFKGVVDQAAIYDTKLTDSEIAANWAAGPVVIPEPTTVLLVIVGCGLMMVFKRRKAA
jgi:hypothetical protein